MKKIRALFIILLLSGTVVAQNPDLKDLDAYLEQMTSDWDVISGVDDLSCPNG